MSQIVTIKEITIGMHFELDGTHDSSRPHSRKLDIVLEASSTLDSHPQIGQSVSRSF